MSYQNAIVGRIAQARANHQRVLFHGFDPELIASIAGHGLFDGLDCLFVTTKAETLGSKAVVGSLSFPLHPLGAVEDYQPDLVLLMPGDNQNPALAYETFFNMIDIRPSAVLMPERYWGDRLIDQDDLADRLVARIPPEIKGGLTTRELNFHLCDSLRHIFTSNIPGDIVNLGVYQGWSMYLIGLMMEHFNVTGRTLWGFDTFGGFVQSDHLLDNYVHGSACGASAYVDTSVEQVGRNLGRFPFVKLVSGDIAQTIDALKGRQIALALFDMDDYTPTAAAIDTVYDNLAHGGVMMHDHYAFQTLIFGNCVGQRLAVKEFLARRPMFSLRGTNVFIKV